MAEAKKDYDEMLEKYEQDILGLAKPEKISCDKYISISFDSIKSMDVDDIQSAIFDLTKYIMYINRILNKEKAWKRLVESKIEEIIASRLPNVMEDVGWNGKMLIAKYNNEETRPYLKILKEINLKIDSLSSLPYDIQRVSDTYKDIMFEKIRKLKIQNAN